MAITSNPRTTDRRGLVPTVGIATAIAIVAALAVYALARLAGANLVVAPPGQPTGTVNAVSVVVITLVSGVGALVLALLLARLAPTRARLVFLILALAVLALSFAGPLGASAQTSTAFWLSLMHVVVASAIIPLTLRALPGTASGQGARQ